MADSQRHLDPAELKAGKVSNSDSGGMLTSGGGGKGTNRVTRRQLKREIDYPVGGGVAGGG